MKDKTNWNLTSIGQPALPSRSNSPAGEAVPAPVGLTWSSPTQAPHSGGYAIGTPADDGGFRPALQSGVLAYRRTEDGTQVLLVSKKRSKRWGIPKGKVEPHLSFGENAAKEAFEEAGVKGTVSPSSAAMFRMMKRVPGQMGTRVVEVWVYLLEVAECLKTWPEKGQREIGWFSCDEAARRLGEPVLVDLCRRLGQD